MASIVLRDLVSKLRTRLNDNRASVLAFTLSVTGTCTKALLEIGQGLLVITVSGGEAMRSIELQLSDPQYATVQRLVNALSRYPWLNVEQAETIDNDAPSIELRVDGFPDISSGKSAVVKSRLWSNGQIEAFLQDGLQLHNPNYTIVSAPKAEYPYILLKANAAALRSLAGDTARRKGLDADADTLLSLAQDLDKQYDSDFERMRRVIPVAKADMSNVGTGDAIQGTLVRKSYRGWGREPVRAAIPPYPPTLFPPGPNDVEDTRVRLSWSQSRDPYYRTYELWRDTSPNVSRNTAGYNVNTSLAVQPLMPVGSAFTGVGTSKRVLGGSGVWNQSPTFDGNFYWTLSDFRGTPIVTPTFIDGVIWDSQLYSNATPAPVEPLEPDTDYWYKLYLINDNGEASCSEAVKVRTKTQRALFLRGQPGFFAADFMDVREGPLNGGTAITFKVTNLVPGVVVVINGKRTFTVSQTLSTITVYSPGQSNPQFVGMPLDVALVSPNGLVDIAKAAWKYTAPTGEFTGEFTDEFGVP